MKFSNQNVETSFVNLRHALFSLCICFPHSPTKGRVFKGILHAKSTSEFLPCMEYLEERHAYFVRHLAEKRYYHLNAGS